MAVGGHTADQIDAYQLAHRQGQPGKVGTARPDEAVDDIPHHIGAAQVGKHRQHQKQEHSDQRQLALGQISYKAADRLGHIFRFGIAPSWGSIGPWHYPPTPSC